MGDCINVLAEQLAHCPKQPIKVHRLALEGLTANGEALGPIFGHREGSQGDDRYVACLG